MLVVANNFWMQITAGISTPRCPLGSCPGIEYVRKRIEDEARGTYKSREPEVDIGTWIRALSIGMQDMYSP